VIEEEKFDVVYTCGPEIMMKKILDLCKKNKIRMQASLERYMKCGIGICGSCGLGPYRVCVDGPVFSKEGIKRMDEFGIHKRDSSGRRIPV
ncbi:MAG: dihydroorotate dehydrogenase electron transfer subunit, partial [Candidatus Bathyarchaeia archaeon]